MSKKSIYEYVKESVVNGELPEGFMLSRKLKDGILMDDAEDNEAAYMVVDGFLDGVTFFHTMRPKALPEDKKKVRKALRRIALGRPGDADRLFDEMSRKYTSICFIDILQECISQESESFATHVDKYMNYAKERAFGSDSVNLVKTGMMLMEPLVFMLHSVNRIRNDQRITDDLNEVKEGILTLGLCDEFTVYAIFVIRCWEDGNKEVLELGKKVHGWGRIFAVDQLDYDSEEVKHWLCCGAVNNTIMRSYTARLCWDGSDAADRLKRKITYEEFEGIRDIIDGLMEDGPGSNITMIPDYEESINNFIAQAEHFSLNDEDRRVIEKVKNLCVK